MPPLEGDGEEFVAIQPIAPLAGKGLKIFTSNKLSTRLPVLLGQMKAEKDLYKIEKKIREIYIFFINIKKSPKNMGVYIKGNLAVIREPKTFHFNFDLPEHVVSNLKHETKFIISFN